MKLPEPRPGLVLRYAYLWFREFAEGREEGAKDRPCAIILTVVDDEGTPRVSVVPITHTPPTPAEDAVEIPSVTKDRLGLDADRSWIVLTEINLFTWPGPDLRPIPDRDPPEFAYGYLPPKLFHAVRTKIAARIRAKLLQGVRRTD